jgi:DNA invertase Pin-like site-specific DNA recombinase
MYSAFAEFQRDLIVENTLDALATARSKGVRLGRPLLVDRKRLRAACDAIATEGISLRTAAARYDVSLTTLRRFIQEVVKTGGLGG